MKQFIKGAATFLPGAYDLFSRKVTGGTDSARYCYSVWLRHLVMAKTNGLSTDPQVVAELGPGDSIGTGLAALLTGADHYYALDVVRYADTQRNLQTFCELVDLFRERADIPGADEFPLVEPYLESYTFPASILTDERLNSSLTEDRIQRIRRSISDTDSRNCMIQYKVPWDDASLVETGSVDIVLSQAVLEHVNDLPRTYEQMHRWLKATGFMSHSIDFKSHGSANTWNGHWTYADFTWKIIKGKRPFMINRQPHSTHIELLMEAGFHLVCDVTNELPSSITSDSLAPPFKNMQRDDIVTGSTFIQAVKQER